MIDENWSMEQYWFWLTNIEGIGQKTIKRLLEYAQNPRELYYIKGKEIEKLLSPKLYNNFIKSRNREKIEQNYRELKKKGIQYYSKEHEQFPKRLHQMEDMPYCLYGKGKLPKDNQSTIAIVGARCGTAYGREMARYFARELSKLGIMVISGMARGIDSVAQEAAISEVGSSCAILGCGIDICYPKENFSLYEKLAQKGGVFSEYAPSTPPKAGFFPMRNRIISGLSDGILVIEAREKSGTLITVDHALAQGKEVYALPGRSGDMLSVGCNRLIQMGAKLILDMNDLMEDYPMIRRHLPQNYENYQKTLAKNQRVVYSCLSLEPKYIDSIIREARLSVQEVLSILFELEMMELVKQIIPNYYMISK